MPNVQAILGSRYIVKNCPCFSLKVLSAIIGVIFAILSTTAAWQQRRERQRAKPITFSWKRSGFTILYLSVIAALLQQPEGYKTTVKDRCRFWLANKIWTFLTLVWIPILRNHLNSVLSFFLQPSANQSSSNTVQKALHQICVIFTGQNRQLRFLYALIFNFLCSWRDVISGPDRYKILNPLRFPPKKWWCLHSVPPSFAAIQQLQPE